MRHTTPGTDEETALPYGLALEFALALASSTPAAFYGVRISVKLLSLHSSVRHFCVSASPRGGLDQFLMTREWSAWPNGTPPSAISR